MISQPMDPFGMKSTLNTPLGKKTIWRLEALTAIGDIHRLPYSLRVLLEACARQIDGKAITEEHVKILARHNPAEPSQQEIPFLPARVLLQDFTGVPALVDLAAMRSAMVRLGGDPKRVNPLVPVDLVIDHSVQVDVFRRPDALKINAQWEFKRNRERYEFLKWGQQAFHNFRVVPPATGIVHQVNLEYLARVVWEKEDALFPDSLVGTDSHTTMINGLGIVGWGVGGIEAEAVMLGQPMYMLIPEVVGYRLTGRLKEGATATDLVLTITERLRKHGVVDKFVEFFGEALDHLPVATRATIANMAPEYGATMGFFPVDEQVLKYLYLTGRSQELVDTVERYYKEQNLFRDDSADIQYSTVLELDLSEVEPSLAGPRRPQDRIPLSQLKTRWQKELQETFGKSGEPPNTQNDWSYEGGANSPSPAFSREGEGAVSVQKEAPPLRLNHGDVVIAAITSCTNTSNPEVMIAAGLLARKAREKGLQSKPWVKTSMAPGSRVVTEYLKKAGLLEDLEALGFHVVGYGCTTCIGNSGPLPEPVRNAIKEGDLVACAVLSGNRNFEGRINPDVRANFLASPPLVVAFALWGTVNVDPYGDPLSKNGRTLYLKDIWPTTEEIRSVIEACISRDQFIEQYANVFEGTEEWKAIQTPGGELYDWPPTSTYIQEPPYFHSLTLEPPPITPILRARCLVKLGDSITTDHISPAGAISPESPAGQYLISLGVSPQDFNSYGARRGNDRVMTRGTFANVRVKNQLVPGKEGGFTVDFTDGQVKWIYEAVENYQRQNIPLLVLAGKDYGMGSSRDWAAKGPCLLGVRAVLAESFERIHRANLVGMGVLPLSFLPGQNAESLGLKGTEVYDILIDDSLAPRKKVTIRAEKEDGSEIAFEAIARIDTEVELEYYRNGGILQTVLRMLLKG